MSASNPTGGGRRPTHVLKVKVKGSDAHNTVGVGWLNEDGSMSLSLRPCVVLSWQDNVSTTAFPDKPRET